MANLKFYKSNNLPTSAAEGSVCFDTSSKSIKLKTSSGWEVYGQVNPTSGSISSITGLQAALDSKANASHTHTKSQITDFPTSMPASDVYSWAKASSKPSYTYSEVGAAAASHTHSYAGSDSAGGPANIVRGLYTSNGGQQPPSYVSGGTVRFNMMNAFQGISTFNGGYADVMMMDCYIGSDVPFVTALAIQKTTSPRAWIATGAKGDTTTWLNRAEVITSDNIGSQTVSKASTADTANSVAWANVSGKPSFATVATSGSYNDLSNKPSIPTVNNATITISQSGKSNQTFTLNQSGNTTISLNDTVVTIPGYVTKTRETSTSSSISLALGKTTEVTLAQATTFTLPSAPTTDSEKLREVVLKIKVGSSTYTTTWPSGIAWANGEAPTLEANTYYEFNFSYNIDAWCCAYQSFTVV